MISRIFMNNHENFILEFFSVQHFSYPQKFCLGSCKIHKSTKIFTLETLGYTVLPYSYREQTKTKLFVQYALLTTLTVDGLQGGRFTILGN